MSPNTMIVGRRHLHAALAAIGALSIPALRLPFAWNESPWSVLSNGDEILGGYRVLAWPFLLSLPITLSAARSFAQDLRTGVHCSMAAALAFITRTALVTRSPRTGAEAPAP